MAFKFYVVFYAVDENIEYLAKEVEKGANNQEGVEAKLWQVPETLSTEELATLGEPAKKFKSDVPIITADELSKADGFFFGFPIISGKMAAQFKAFIDATGDLGKAEQLAGKAAGIFMTTGSKVDIDDETIPTAITQLGKHRLVYVPTEFGFTYCTGKTKKVERGAKGTYGAASYTGSLSDTSELEDAFCRGVFLAAMTMKLAMQKKADAKSSEDVPK